MATDKKTKAPTTAPVEDNDPFNWGGTDMPTGFEMTKPEDMGIPFLIILQKGSPEVDETHKDYAKKKIEGAKAGMIMNTLSREIVYRPGGEPLLFVPCAFEKLYQEWKPRDEGGGFVTSHQSAAILRNTERNEKNQDILPNGNQIITTAYFYGFSFLGGEWVRTIIAFTSTQLKKARTWLNMATSLKYQGRSVPLYSHIYKITTVVESNAKGSWYGWDVKVDRILRTSDQALITSAVEVASQMTQQRLLAAPSEEAGPTDPDAY